MKLTIILMLFFTFHVTANTLAQRVTIVRNNIHLSEVFKDIEQQTGFHFFYDKALIQNTDPIDVTLKDATLQQALSTCLKGQQLTYNIVKNTVVIRKEQKTSLQTANISMPTVEQIPPPIPVHGVVKDEKGNPLMDASVIIKGTNKGTTTNVQGEFTIVVPDNKTILIISFTGYNNKEITVGNRTSINVSLTRTDDALNAVVITALGIKREAKSLTYSSQTVDTKSINEARELNVMNSLEGKVAGLSINSSGSGVGAQDYVVLRGNRSISGDSQPLYVVDGVPVRGDISNLSPDNIASITVLKGANAAALYGSSAQNGVIMITTLQAKEGVAKVSFNSNFMLQQPVLNIEFQNVYGQGQGGIYDKTSEFSWGPRMDGQKVDTWSIDPADSGKQYSLTPQPDNIINVFQTGYNMSDNVIASIGGKRTQTVVSYTFTDAHGILPGNNLKRHNVSLRINNQILRKLSLDTKIAYTNQKINNGYFGGRYNPTQMITEMPRSIQDQQLKNYDYVNENGLLIQNYFNPGSATGGNPYWILNRTPNDQLLERVIGLASLTYDFSEAFKLMVRLSVDQDNTSSEEKLYYNNYASAPSGRYTVTKSSDQLLDGDFLFSYKKIIAKNWNVEANAGGELKKVANNSLSSNTGAALIVPNFFTLSNTNLPVTSYDPGATTNKQSLYALATISWKNAIFLNATGRNDWSSTLPSDNWSYFYPSVGLSMVLSDLLKFPKFFNFAKIRASQAWVGNDAPAYMLRRTATFMAGGNNGFLQLGSTLPNSNLLPEKTSSAELGFNLRFFENRLGLDVTHYVTNTGNQLFTIALPVGSGAAQFYTNGGNIQNKGWEVLLSTTPVSNINFKWDFDINFSANSNLVKKISDQRPKVNLTPSGFVSNFIIQQGQPFGEIYSRGWLRDDQGRVLIATNGLPQLTNGLTVPIGNFNPKWQGSISNTFSYRNFNVSFLIEHRQGGAIVSGTEAILDGAGVTKRTLNGREGGLIFGENLFPGETAIMPDGSKNTIAINSETFWRGIGGRNSPVGEAFVEDATNTRLREFTIGWNLPKTLLKNSHVSNLRVSVVGRNLFFITRADKNLDPDFLNSVSPTALGTQQFTPITTRSYGVNLNVEF